GRPRGPRASGRRGTSRPPSRGARRAAPPRPRRPRRARGARAAGPPRRPDRGARAPPRGAPRAAASPRGARQRAAPRSGAPGRVEAPASWERQEACHAGGDAVPLAPLHRQPLLTGARQAVEARLASVLRLAPLRVHEALVFEALERGVERAELDAE